MPYDLIIRGGNVVDGSGLPGYRADVGVQAGRITAIGDLKGQLAKETVDAEGHVVSPGFIDGHTHMDAQIFWDPLGTCSCWNGVTSVIMGNCGFTVAPCAEKDKRLVFSNLERAEDLSPEAMEAGIPWSWETIPEYFETLEKLPKGINYAAYAGHSAIRTYVMRERAFTDLAGDDDLAAMCKQVEIAIRTGAVGLSTARNPNHRTAEGRPVASRISDWRENKALCQVMADLGYGVYEISRGINNFTAEQREEEIEALREICVDRGVPVTFGGAWYYRKNPNLWRDQFALVDEATAAGGRMLIQATSTWVGSLRSFETAMPFDAYPVWKDFRKLPLAEQAKGMRDPAMRRKLVDAIKNNKVPTDPSLPNILLREVDWKWFFPQETPMPPHRSIAEIAAERGVDPIEAMMDVALEHDLKIFFINPSNNEDQDFCLALVRHPKTAVTFSDAGAHVASVINPVQAHLLGHWVRTTQSLTLEAAIRKVSFDIAAFWGLKERGLIREGWHADLTIFDPETIQPDMPQLVHDLPTGAERILQKADGIKMTVVNGQVLMRDNQHSGALPGKLLRGLGARGNH
jgi:N-acyl-D-amino-acid deacylase